MYGCSDVRMDGWMYEGMDGCRGKGEMEEWRNVWREGGGRGREGGR